MAGSIKPESGFFGSFHINKRYLQPLSNLRRLMLLLLLVVTPWVTASEVKQAPGGDHVLEVFLRDGCPHCARAKEFLLKFGSERPWLQIIYYSVDHDKIALNGLTGYSQEAGIWPPGVPTFVMNGKILAGFDNAENPGPLLTNLVEQASISPQQTEIESKLRLIRLAHKLCRVSHNESFFLRLISVWSTFGSRKCDCTPLSGQKHPREQSLRDNRISTQNCLEHSVLLAWDTSVIHTDYWST